MSISYLYTLPIELIHRIIDYIDTETLFFSLQNVCKHFYTIVNTYNQHQLDFRSITKPKFDFIHRLINPENIISLVISDGHRTGGQIKLFLSLFDLRTFTRLRSLALIDVTMSVSIEYLQDVSTDTLDSLSIDYVNQLGLTNNLVSLSLKKFINLRKLNISKTSLILDNIQSPIQHMKLSQCIINTQMYNILLGFPHLETLSLNNVSIPNIDENLTAIMKVKSKLKFLSIEGCGVHMNMAAAVLVLTPSLVRLKLVSWSLMAERFWDGNWWSEFFEMNLMQLKIFEFFLEKRISYNTDVSQDVESIINSFRTPFWLKKQWYVACNYYKNIQRLELYSIPICKSTISYQSTRTKISSSNLKIAAPYIMDNIHSLYLPVLPTTAELYDNVIIILEFYP
ncbi:unnamed protein product [Rotaria magnacalcarata]|uniref:F-box domain-containing protein n=2 Tax=Rotaria magnacalcarata TaxID=392030 RepID=A0A819SJD2_9BILA|nr:unnamed protein product [Rotaria magnacalcarata]CAF4062405.1 unnamed protein product [Rotaria magnacalcarata]